MKFLKTLSIALFAVLVMGACLSDNHDELIDPVGPDPEESILNHAILVVNEGQFPNPGSISLITPDFKFSLNDIYDGANETKEDLGGVLQSMFFNDEEEAFIISNGGNFITRVDRYSFEDKGRIQGGLDAPRYGVVIGNKAYVTNQGDFSTGEDDYVAVINLDENTVEHTITVGSYAEHIFEGADGLLYVEGTAFDQGNKVVVIDPASNSIVDTFETADALNSIVLDEQYVYALSAGKLQKFDRSSGDVEAEIEIDYEDTPNKLRYEEGDLYYTVGTKIYQYSTDFGGKMPELPVVQYSSTSEFGAMYGFEVHEGNFYVADAGDFASDGVVEIFNSEGVSLARFTTQIGPNGFYFNNKKEPGTVAGR